jgi:ubiquitin-like 1-activating enzyme E1 B
MGNAEFPQLLFDKVYKDDITRLRSMEEMWKTRRAPEALDYATIMGEAPVTEESIASILGNGQKAWSLHENVLVFKHR